MNKITATHIAASDGMTLVRKSNNEVMGKELYLGKTYYVGGVRVTPPIVETAENFTEVTDEEAELLRYTYKTSNAVEAIIALYDADKWSELTDEQKQRYTARINETDYGTLATEFIRAKYPVDRMEAIMNNHLDDEDDLEHLREWAVMQNWRKASKHLAKESIILK